MSLLRLFYIPACKSAADGAYIKYDLDEMLAVVKLLSHKHKCMVIGEDLGTVPPGFRQKMAKAGCLSYRVQWFERSKNKFRAPDKYPALSLACVETHDMAPLKSYWNEKDIDERRELNLYPEPADEVGHREARKQERKLMFNALAAGGLLPPGFDPANPDVPYSKELGASIHNLVASTKSNLVMVSAADLDMSVRSQNVPGTSEKERPANWRQKLGRNAEELMRSPLMQLIRPALSSRHNSSVQGKIRTVPQQPQICHIAEP
jgi:4-alpha-glucanotransferase